MKLLFLFIFFLTHNSWADSRQRLLEISEKQIQILSQANSTKDWLKNVTGLSKVEKEILLRAKQSPKTLPEFRLVKLPGKIVLSSTLFEADLGQVDKGILLVNGRPIPFEKTESRLDLAERIIQQTKKKPLNLADFFVPNALADEAHIDKTCLGKWEFLHRSPYPMMNSPFGYVPYVFIANIALTGINNVVDYLADCKTQAKELSEILRAEKIAIKEIDCGAEEDGSDRSIEFFTPEKEGKEYKIRSFNLNYAMGLAQESPEEDENGKKKGDLTIYNFGADHLKEVRQLKVKENKYVCSSMEEGSSEFRKKKDDVERFRKIFYYIGQNNSCSACASEILKEVRTPKAPDYLAKSNPPVKVPKKKSPGEERSTIEVKNTPAN